MIRSAQSYHIPKDTFIFQEDKFMTITKVSNYSPQNQQYQEFVDDREELQSFLHFTAPAIDTTLEISTSIITNGVIHGICL